MWNGYHYKITQPILHQKLLKVSKNQSLINLKKKIDGGNIAIQKSGLVLVFYIKPASLILLKLVKRNSFREIKEDHAERGMKAQSNLFEGDMLYNGHLAIADSF